jgi:orotidine-5'-phosphate decarboxylase
MNDRERVIQQLEALADTKPHDIPDALSQIAEGLLLLLQTHAAD